MFHAKALNLDIHASPLARHPQCSERLCYRLCSGLRRRNFMNPWNSFPACNEIFSTYMAYTTIPYIVAFAAIQKGQCPVRPPVFIFHQGAIVQYSH